MFAVSVTHDHRINSDRALTALLIVT